MGGLPADGYTAWMERMIDDPRIHVTLETDFFDGSQPYNKAALAAAGVPVVYTGPVDRYFDYSLGELKWRTVDFKEVRYDEGDHFGCPVMNFSDADVPYTRAIEFKNFNPERAASQNPDRTVVWEEYSRFAERGDEPYYPINTEADKALYARYEELAKAEPKTVFGGRLGTYKYYDMHNVIDTALTRTRNRSNPFSRSDDTHRFQIVIKNPQSTDGRLGIPHIRRTKNQARHTSLPAALAAATSASSCSSLPSTSPLMNSSTKRRASPSSCCTAGDFMK